VAVFDPDFRFSRRPLTERIEKAAMKRRFGMKLVLGFLVSSHISCFGQQTGTERAVPITVIVYNRANVNPEVLAVAKKVVIRVMSAAGFAVTCIATQDLNTGFPIADSAEQTELSKIGFLSVVITPAAYRGSRPNEAGFAAVTTGRYRRAYVFLDRVTAFSEKVASFRRDRVIGTVLGHVICHELGHLLMPRKSHSPFGIMRADWDFQQWDEAVEGLLLFSPRQAEIMQREIQDRCTASIARNRRPC
jgi:hypothetical protein